MNEDDAGANDESKDGDRVDETLAETADGAQQPTPSKTKSKKIKTVQTVQSVQGTHGRA